MRGGGTSTSGQAVGAEVVIDMSRHYTAVIDVDPLVQTARVQPGIVLDDLQAEARTHGLLFGPDPSTHSRCTIGGMIGNNSCGSHSLAWGRTSDNVIELEVLTYRGVVLTVGPLDRKAADAAIVADGETGKLIAGLRELAMNNLGPLRTELGRFPRQVSGYALEHLLPENGFDLARALVGSEGTCAVILSATLRLTKPPPERAVVVLSYTDTISAAAAVPALLQPWLLALEGLDRSLTDIITRPATRATVDTLPPGQAWLFADIGGTALDVPARAKQLIATATDTDGFVGALTVSHQDQMAALWRIREDGAGLATRLPDGSEAWPGLEDAAVPPVRLAAYLSDFTELLERYDLRGAIYGHFGEGCLHVRINFDFTSDIGTKTFRAFSADAAQLIAAHGGSLSGEHGDGQARSELLPVMYSTETMAAFATFKTLWDPDGRLNPGMIVSPLPIDADLRIDSARRTPEPMPLNLPFTADDADFAKATRRCVGVGKCRTSHPGPSVMCPSYQVTGEEVHSTRGRARVLYEMTQGDLIPDGWRSTAVRDALDLCLSCKACSSDCPVGVDVATYKTEFLSHHYAKRVRPASHYSMGWLPLWCRVAARMPLVLNALTRSPLSPLIKRAGGIAAERDIPQFARYTFLRSHRAERRQQRRTVSTPSRGPVLLWADSFNNHFSPEVLHAAVRVLDDAGFAVEVLDRSLCCGLTWITTGQLGMARRIAGAAIDALAPAVATGKPIVVLEPSCAAAFRDDVPELLHNSRSAADVGGAVVSLAELLQRDAADWSAPQVATKSISQTHCHQHASTGAETDQQLLERLGVHNTTLQSGCCGLAGNFGFERSHYDVSLAVGEQVLLPAVRSATADTVVLADGFSCRTQISQQTERTGRHIAELIADSLTARDSGTGTRCPPTPRTTSGAWTRRTWSSGSS